MLCWTQANTHTHEGGGHELRDGNPEFSRVQRCSMAVDHDGVLEHLHIHRSEQTRWGSIVLWNFRGERCIILCINILPYYIFSISSLASCDSVSSADIAGADIILHGVAHHQSTDQMEQTTALLTTTSHGEGNALPVRPQ